MNIVLSSPDSFPKLEDMIVHLVSVWRILSSVLSLKLQGTMIS
jgi:hypothetical protein